MERKSLIERVEDLKQNQDEILEAIEARMGENGKLYVDSVKKTACVVAVCSHLLTDDSNAVISGSLSYASECVIICGCMQAANILGLLHDLSTAEKFSQEFTGDVVALVKKSTMRVSRSELSEGGEE